MNKTFLSLGATLNFFSVLSNFKIPAKTAFLDKLWIAQRLVNAQYYPINKVWLGGTPVISIYDPDDAQVYSYFNYLA